MSAVTGLDHTPVTSYGRTHTNDELINLALNSPSPLVKELGVRLHFALCGEYDDEGNPKSDEEESTFSVTKVTGSVTTCQEASTYEVKCPGCFHDFKLSDSLNERI